MIGSNQDPTVANLCMVGGIVMIEFFNNGMTNHTKFVHCLLSSMDLHLAEPEQDQFDVAISFMSIGVESSEQHIGHLHLTILILQIDRRSTILAE